MTCQHSSAFVRIPEVLRFGRAVGFRSPMFGQVASRCGNTQRWWGEAPDLPETVRKATLLVESMVASAEAFAEPRPRVCNRR